MNKEIMQGLIIKILSDKCYVKVKDEIIICTIRGVFRKMKLNPLVGDLVLIDEKKKCIIEILPRKNQIRRPPVSNITQAIIVTSLVEPDLSTNLIDKILIELEYNHIKPIICITKKDLLKENEQNKYQDILKYYEKIGYLVLYNDELDKIKKIFKDEITVFIGQTGAGKSTLLNKLVPNLNLKTNEISYALNRGKHTTRHIEIFSYFDGLILDTPGFSALEFDNMTKKEIRDSFIEFKKYPCMYKDCMHIMEDECEVKKAVLENKIMAFRYDNYCKFQKEALDECDKYKRK